MLKINALRKTFPDFNLGPLQLEIPEGEYFVLLGPSGNGKSVLLELIAGMLRPDGGEIRLDGENITQEEMHKRKCGLLFQDYALFPNMTVFENIAYPLKNQRLTKVQIRNHVFNYAHEFEIESLLERPVDGLSGGEKQRVALARVLALQPKILMLDEPASSIDAGLKIKLHQYLRNINKQGLTILHVTHDYEEALALGQTIGIMHKGKIIQSGIPEEVFRHPANQFVAQLVGIKNFYRVQLKASESANTSIAVINENVSFSILYEAQTGTGYVFIESRNIILSNEAYQSSALNQFRGIVVQMIQQPNACEIELDIGVPVYARISSESLQKLGIKEGKKLWISFKASSCIFQAI